MRIINKQQFYKMPEGTIFSECSPCILDGLMVKGDTYYDRGIPIDYLECNLIDCIDCNHSGEYADILEKAITDNDFSFSFNYNNFGRNGMYDEDQQYMVYEKKDLEKLINFLKKYL